MSDVVKEGTEDFAKLLAEHDARDEKVQTGDKIRGKIITISGDDVFLDLGLKQDGVMDRHEIQDEHGEDKYQAGDEVEGYVASIGSQGVRIARSLNGAGMYALEEAQASGIPVEGRVTGTCKGGYNVEIMGKSAFCPGSQIGFFPQDEDLTGKSLQFLVSRIENHGRNIVVSRRALIERERQENLDKFVSGINIGDIINGKVVRLAPYGAFVELAPGIEGMAHISELGWSRVNSPEEIINIGDVVPVKILSMEEDDKKRLRISLSIKQAMEDPWATVADRIKAGDVLDGIVRRLAPFGAFIEIAPGIEGLAHLSELSWEKRINRPDELLQPGESVMVKIRDIDPDNRRISLSLKDAMGDPWDQAEKLLPDQIIEGKVESISPFGVFVRLLPGVTGLLPNSVIKDAKGTEKLNCQPGQDITVRIARIDIPARKISLRMPGESDSEEKDKSWRQHTKSHEPASDNTGLMAEALKKAFQKKGDTRK